MLSCIVYICYPGVYIYVIMYCIYLLSWSVYICYHVLYISVILECIYLLSWSVYICYPGVYISADLDYNVNVDLECMLMRVHTMSKLHNANTEGNFSH